MVERKDEKPAHSSEEANDDTEQGPELGTMRVTAGFDEIVVWGHEAVADAAGDPYVRGIEEWLQVADKVRHSGKLSVNMMLKDSDSFIRGD